MQQFRRVLVGLDWDFTTGALTAGSLAAIEQTRWVVALGAERVDFLHSVESDRFVEKGERGYLVRHEGLPAEGLAQMEAVVKSFADAGVEAELHIRRSKPWLAIVREVLLERTDLVLLGKHDERAPGAKLGSVSAKVLRKCPGTVWVIRPGAQVPPKVVLAATDLTQVGQHAMARAAWVCDHSKGSDLHIVHVFSIPLQDQFEMEVTAEVLDRMRDSARSLVLDQMETVEFGGEPHLHVGCSAPYRAITEGVEKLDADLLVMGTVARGGVAGVLMGNTAEKVLPNVDCSLLVVKPEDFVCPVHLEEPAEASS